MNNSKRTDYVNAQFDDAELRIEELYETIAKEEGNAGENPIACDYYYMAWGWFHDSSIRALYIWKEKGRVHMICMAVLWDGGGGFGWSLTLNNIPSWGIPKKTYEKTYADGQYLRVYPDDGGVGIACMSGASYSDWPAMYIKTSWKA